MDFTSLMSKERKLYTLAFILQEDQILLGLKKRGFGTGIWNGFGGKALENENILEAAIREIQEECSLTVNEKDLIHIAVNHFELQNSPEIHEVHIFKCSRFQGEPQESEEMLPRWFSILERPRSQMWVDDDIWYPYLLNDRPFRGYFLFEDFTKSAINKAVVVELHNPMNVLYREEYDENNNRINFKLI